MKTDVKVPSKVLSKKAYFLLKKAGPLSGVLSESGTVSQWYGSADPDPYQIQNTTLHMNHFK
jgi:hypothetical protein